MKFNQTASNMIKAAGKSTAKVSVGIDCSFLIGQPKMPKAMLNQIASKYSK